MPLAIVHPTTLFFVSIFKVMFDIEFAVMFDIEFVGFTDDKD